MTELDELALNLDAVAVQQFSVSHEAYSGRFVVFLPGGEEKVVKCKQPEKLEGLLSRLPSLKASGGLAGHSLVNAYGFKWPHAQPTTIMRVVGDDAVQEQTVVLPQGEVRQFLVWKCATVADVVSGCVALCDLPPAGLYARAASTAEAVLEPTTQVGSLDEGCPLLLLLAAAKQIVVRLQVCGTLLPDNGGVCQLRDAGLHSLAVNTAEGEDGTVEVCCNVGLQETLRGLLDKVQFTLCGDQVQREEWAVAKDSGIALDEVQRVCDQHASSFLVVPRSHLQQLRVSMAGRESPLGMKALAGASLDKVCAHLVALGGQGSDSTGWKLLERDVCVEGWKQRVADLKHCSNLFLADPTDASSLCSINVLVTCGAAETQRVCAFRPSSTTPIASLIDVVGLESGGGSGELALSRGRSAEGKLANVVDPLEILMLMNAFGADQSCFTLSFARECVQVCGRPFPASQERRLVLATPSTPLANIRSALAAQLGISAAEDWDQVLCVEDADGEVQNVGVEEKWSDQVEDDSEGLRLPCVYLCETEEEWVQMRGCLKPC